MGEGFPALAANSARSVAEGRIAQILLVAER